MGNVCGSASAVAVMDQPMNNMKAPRRNARQFAAARDGVRVLDEVGFLYRPTVPSHMAQSSRDEQLRFVMDKIERLERQQQHRTRLFRILERDVGARDWTRYFNARPKHRQLHGRAAESEAEDEKEAKRDDEDNDMDAAQIEAIVQRLLPLLAYGMPPAVRRTMWPRAMGVPEMKRAHPGLYRYLLANADAITADDAEIAKNWQQILLDVPRTFGGHRLFHRTPRQVSKTQEGAEASERNQQPGVAHTPDGSDSYGDRLMRATGGDASLARVLRVFAIAYEPTRYVQGMNLLAGTFLLYVGTAPEDEETVFWMLVSLMHRYGMDEFFRAGLTRLMDRLRELGHYLGWMFPALRSHFGEQNIEPFCYATPWFLSGFVYNMDVRLAARVWDHVFMLPPAAIDVIDESSFVDAMDNDDHGDDDNSDDRKDEAHFVLDMGDKDNDGKEENGENDHTCTRLDFSKLGRRMARADEFIFRFGLALVERRLDMLMQADFAEATELLKTIRFDDEDEDEALRELCQRACSWDLRSLRLQSYPNGLHQAGGDDSSRHQSRWSRFSKHRRNKQEKKQQVKKKKNKKKKSRFARLFRRNKNQ